MGGGWGWSPAGVRRATATCLSPPHHVSSRTGAPGASRGQGGWNEGADPLLVLGAHWFPDQETAFPVEGASARGNGWGNCWGRGVSTRGVERRLVGPQSPQAPLPECLGSLEWPPRRVEPQYFSTGFTRLQPPRGFPLIRNWSEKRLDSLDPARGLLLGPGGAGGPQSSGRRRGWLAAAGTLTLPVMRTAGAVCTALSTHWPCAGSLEPRWVSPGRGPRRPLSLPLS